MSHFALLVTVDAAVKEADIEAAVTKLLAPFDEDKTVPPYIKKTRAQLIDDERQEIRDYEAGTYAKYLESPDKYAEDCFNDGHLNYLRGTGMKAIGAVATLPTFTDEEIRNLSFPDKLNLVYHDEILFRIASMRYETAASAEEADESEWLDTKGNLWSTYNPQSQWDWWVIGGRWDALLNQIPNGSEDTQWGKRTLYRDGKNILRRRDLRSPQTTYAMLTKEGEWVERGSMGWFGMSSGDKEEVDWDKEVADQMLKTPGEDWLVVVDCHI